MSEVVGQAASLVDLLALVTAAGTLLATRSAAVALPVLLDLLLAASLLRLALHPTPAQLAGTALLVLVKRLAASGVRRAGAARAGAQRA